MADWSSQTTHTDISAFSENPELRKELRRWRLKIAAILLMIFAVVGFSAKPAYRIFRDSRINRNLEEAKVAARLEDWGKTRDRARSVLLARPGDFEAFRLWTKALGKMGEPRTYMAAAQLFTSPKASQQDRIDALEIMALQAPQAVALGAYASLPEELRNQASFRAAITPLLVQRREFDVAEKGLREASDGADYPKAQLELIRSLCGRPTSEHVAESRKIFATLIAKNASEEALAALLILGEAPKGLAPGEPLPDLQRWVEMQPKAQTLHHLLALHPALEAMPETADTLVENVITRFLAVDPGILGTWLVRQNRVQRALDLLEEPAKTRSDAFIARLNALLRQKKDEEIRVMLAAPPDSADLVEMEIIRAALDMRQGDTISSEAAWTKALNHASFDTSQNRFIEIARAAESCGANKAIEDSWVAAIRSGWGQLPLYQDMLPLVTALAVKGRSEDLLAVCRTLQRFEPANPDLMNNVQYLGLIQGIFPGDKVVTQLEKLLADHPEMPEIESALMLADLVADQPEDAIARLPKLQGSHRVSPMMINALEGSARVMAGQTAEGTELLRTVKWNMFMRQERIVFRDLLMKLKISGLPLPELEVQKVEAAPDQTPAWKKAVDRLEKDRANDVLPALPAPRIPGADRPSN